MITIHLNNETRQGDFKSDFDGITGICSYDNEANEWDITINNTLEEVNPLRSVDMTVHGWIRGRFDTYRDDELTAQRRAFGSLISADILPNQVLRLHITQDPPIAKTERKVLIPDNDPIDARQKLAELQRQINEIAGSLK